MGKNEKKFGMNIIILYIHIILCTKNYDIRQNKIYIYDIEEKKYKY